MAVWGPLGREAHSDWQVWTGSPSHCGLWRWQGRTVSLMKGRTSSSPPGGLLGGRAAPVCSPTHIITAWR